LDLSRKLEKFRYTFFGTIMLRFAMYAVI